LNKNIGISSKWVSVFSPKSYLPSGFWMEDFSTAIFLINRLPMAQLQHLSPYEKLLERPPDYRFLKVFGCTCFPYLVPYNKHKLLPKSNKCVFLGYDSNHKGYCCVDLVTSRVYISRHVTFDESTFLYKDQATSSSSVASPPPNSRPAILQPVPTTPTPQLNHLHHSHLMPLKPYLFPSK
jgi:hypothetical protein